MIAPDMVAMSEEAVNVPPERVKVLPKDVSNAPELNVPVD